MRWIIALGMLVATSAQAHDWYPVNCCTGRDCSAIDPERVTALGNGGYLVDSSYLVRSSDVRFSPDGRFHACFPNSKTIRCFFAPPRSF